LLIGNALALWAPIPHLQQNARAAAPAILST
jgi:hypothetical protein